jgi:hypothetical protein
MMTFQCGILQGLLKERTRTKNATKKDITVIDEEFNIIIRDEKERDRSKMV